MCVRKIINLLYSTKLNTTPPHLLTPYMYTSYKLLKMYNGVCWFLSLTVYSSMQSLI